MKFPNQPSSDIQNALHLIGRALPETDEQIEAFIAGVDSGEIQVPETPDYLKSSAIAQVIREGRLITSISKHGNVCQFPARTSNSGLSSLRMAARNGNGALSEETLRKMEDAQND